MKNASMAGVVWVLAVAMLAAQSKPLAISVKKVYTGDGKSYTNAVVIVKDKKIVAIGEGIAIPEDADRIAFPEAIMTPGLIDCDSTAGLTGIEAEQRSEVTPEFRVIDAVDLGAKAFKRLAVEGVTTVAVHGDTASVIGAQGTVLKTGADDDRIVIASHGLRAAFTHDPQYRGGSNSPPSGPAANVFDRRPTTQMGTVFVFREAFYKASDFVDADSAKIPAAARVMVEVLTKKRALWGAANAYHEIAMALRVAGEFNVPMTIDGGGEAWRAIGELKQSKAAVVYGPVMLPESEAPQGRRFMRGGGSQSGDQHLTTPAILAREGIPFALTAAGGTGEKGLARQAAEAIRAGLDRAAAIAATTSSAAKILGIGDRTGTLAPGMDADLLIWSGEPFEPTSRQDAVFIGGKRVEIKSF